MPRSENPGIGLRAQHANRSPHVGQRSHKIAEALSLLDKAVLEMIRAQQPLTRVLESLCLKIEEQSPG